MSRGAVGQDPSQGWANTTIGDLATRVGSGITPTGGAEVYAHSGVVFLRSQNVTNSGLLLDDVAFIDEATHSRMAASEVFPYDVLINITGASIGRCCYLPDGLGRANANQHVCAIRLSNPNWADAKFLSSLLASSIGQAQVRRFNAGGNREGLNYKQLRSFRLPWPAKESREKIAAVLSIIDDAIEQTEALIAKTQQIKAGLMHDLFTRGVTPDGHLRPRGQGTPTRFGLLPQGWVAGSLLDIADDSRQPILTGPFGADLGNDDFVAEGVPVLRIGNVQSGYLDLADLIFITPRKAKDLCRYIVKPGDLLFARQGATTGRNALATDLVAGCIINYHIIRVALGHDKCAPLFV
jgi:type I restriction enzyme S subunit